MTETGAIQVELKRFEQNWAVLGYKDQEWRWPKKNLPSDCQPGDRLWLTSTHTPVTNELLAKSILNEILKDEAEPKIEA